MTEQYFNFRDLTVEKLEEYFKEIQIRFNEVVDGTVAIKGKRTYDNTIRPLGDVGRDLTCKRNCFGYAKNFYPSKEIRDRATELDGELSKYFIELNQRKDYYYACVEYEMVNWLEEKDSLTPEEVRHFEHNNERF